MVRFITFEGGDGSGKTTQINALESYLRDRRREYISTREPGGTSLGKMLRQVLLQVGEQEIAPSAAEPDVTFSFTLPIVRSMSVKSSPPR